MGREEGTGARAHAAAVTVTDADGGITRRVLLRDGSAATVAVLLAGATSGGGSALAVGLRADGGPAFLTAAELRTLRALLGVLVPADEFPGAAEAGCAEAIDALLGAFRTSPPRIWAGAPFSDRGGARRNDFTRFLTLDRYERRAWRLRIEGSKGLDRLEWAGPVRGWQTTYRDGLAALDRAAGGDFAAAPTVARDVVLRTSRDPDVAAILDTAFPHTLEFLYGAPEYGGNRDLAGWKAIGYDGDVLPRGYTRRQIEQADGASLGALPAELLTGLLGLAPLAASSELAHGVAVRGGGSLNGLRREVGRLADTLGDGATGALDDLAQRLAEEVRRGA